MERKPWVEGSLEVLELAIEQYYMSIGSNLERDMYRYLRVSLINTDDAAELAIKAFIQYYSDARAQRNFHQNLNWVCINGPSYKINISKGLEGKIRYYHHLRDTLYHQGYSLIIPRLEVLNYIVNIIELFTLLFRNDLNESFSYNHRRSFLIDSIILENVLINLCSERKIEVNSKVELSTLIQQMVEEDIISENTRDTIEQVIYLQEQITPRSLYMNEPTDILETVIAIEETIVEIKEMIKDVTNDNN